MTFQLNARRLASNRIFSVLLLSALLAPVASQSQTTGDWNVNADGNWSDTSRWLDGIVPNGVGDTADVVHAIGATRTITLDVPVTLGTLRMGDTNAGSLIVIQGGTLTFDNGGAGAVFDRSAGSLYGGPAKSPSNSDRLDSAVILNDDLTMYMDRNLEVRGGLWNATDAQDITIIGEARVYFNPGTGSSITGVGAINVADGELRFDDAGNQVGAQTVNVGDGLPGASGVRDYARFYLVNTDIEQTVNVNLNGGWFINDLGLLNDQVISGNFGLTGSHTTNIIDVNDAGTPEVHHFTGVISGTGGFTKLNTGAMILSNNNTFEGEMHVNRGRSTNLGSVHLSGADGAVSATSGITISRDGGLYLDNTSVVNNDRVNDAAAMTVNMSGRLRLQGSGTAAVSEKMGALSVTSGTARIDLDLNDASAQQTTLTFDSFQRSVGSTVQFQVIDNVAGSLGTTAQVRVLDGGAATHQIGGGGTNGMTNGKVVIGATGGVGEIPDRLMTFDSADPTLLRVLDFNTEYLLSQNLIDHGVAHTMNRSTVQGNDHNLMIDYNVVRADNTDPMVNWYGPRPVRVTESIAVNSLSFGTNTPNDPGQALNTNDIGSVLVLDPNTVIYLGDKAAGDGLAAVTDTGSGMLVFGRDVNGQPANSTQYIVGGALDFGTREAILINESGASALIRSEIRGSGGLTKAGAQTIYFDNANSYTGTTTIAEGLIDLRHSQGLGGSTRVEVVGTASLYMELGVEVADTVDLVITDMASSHTVLRSNSGHNIWNGDVIIDNVDALGQVIFTPYMNVSTGDTLTVNGTIYGTALTNPSSRDINLHDPRILSTESSAGIININGSFQDTANGAIGATVGSTNENDLLRFMVTGNDQLVVNVRQQWNAAGRLYMEQGILRYEGEGNFWSDEAAAAIVPTHGHSGMRFAGSSSGDVANINFVLTKDGQKLNIDRFDIGSGGSSDNYNDRGNIVLSGANTSGTVTFGNGKSAIVYGASDSARSHTRDLAVFAAGGGTVNMDFRLDDSDTDVHTSFTKIGNGVVNLRGDNTSTSGDVEQVNVAGGLLRLTNYGTSTGARFDNGAMVVFAGGSLEMDGVGSIANETENFTGTAVGGAITAPVGSALTVVGPGSSNVIVTSDAGRTTTLNLGASTVGLDRQSGGTLNFVENDNGGIAAITLNGTGAPAEGTAIGWATYGTAFDAVTQTANVVDFAMIDGSGAVSAFSGSSREEVADAAVWTSGSDVSEGAGAGFAGTTAAGMEVNTIRFNFDGSSSVTIDAGGLTVTSGGILVSSAVATAGSTKSLSGGDLRAGAGADLMVHQFGADAFTIASNIVDNSGTALVKSGSGDLILTGTNTYTGGTHINGGSLTVSATTQLGAVPGATEAANIRINGGTLHTTADMTLEANRGIEIGGNGGGISVDDATTVSYGGVISSVPNINTNSNTNLSTGTFTKTGAGTLLLTGLDNTFTGLLDIQEGTVRWDIDGQVSNTVTLFGTHNEFMDGTILRSGAELSLEAGTAATNSGYTTTIEEWFRFEAGSTLSSSLTNTNDDPADRNYSLRGVIHLDAMGNAGTAAGAMTMNIGRRGINLNDDGGYLTGDGGIMKVGAGSLYFRESSPEWTGQLIVNEGAAHAYSAGHVFGTGSHAILLGHDGSAVGEAASGNGTAGLYLRNESGYNFIPSIQQDVIVRAENGLGSQAKRIGGYYFNHEDVGNFNGALILNDNIEFYYQDDARNSADVSSSSQYRNDTRSFGAPENAEFITINFNGDISGSGDITTNVAQGGTANTPNGSITGAMDDLVVSATWGLNGDNRNWTGTLTISNNAAATSGTNSLDDVDRLSYVRLGNEFALNDNLVRFGTRGHLQLAGIDKTFTQDFQYVGITGTATTAKIENASERDIILTFHADETKVDGIYQDVGVGMEDGRMYGIDPASQGVLNVLKTGAGHTVFGASTGGGDIADSFSSYTGTTTVQEGILYAGSNNALSPYSRFIVNDGAELSVYWDQALTGFDNTIGSLAGTSGAVVDVHNGTLRIGGDGSSGADFAGVVSGNGNVYKVGTGSQRLSGDNTFVASYVAIVEGALIGGSNTAFGDVLNIIQLGGASGFTDNPIDARTELLLDGTANAVSNIVLMNGWDGNDEGITTIGTRATSGTYGFSEIGTVEAIRSFFARADGDSTFQFGGELNDAGVGVSLTKVGTGTVELRTANLYGPFTSAGSLIDGGSVVRHGTLALFDSDALSSTVVELGDRRQELAQNAALATTAGLIGNTGGTFDDAGVGSFVDVQAVVDGVSLTVADVGKRILVKDEHGNPERNGVYEVVSVNSDGTMTLVRAGDFDEAAEMLYGTSITVDGGSQAGGSFFMASQDIETVNADENDPVYWEQDVANADLGLLAAAEDLTIFNDIDINDTNGSGASFVGGSFTSGNSTFAGNITLQHQEGVDNVREVTLTSASDTQAGGGEFGTIFTGMLSEAQSGDTLHVRVAGGGTVTLTNDGNSYTGKTTVGVDSTLVLHGAGTIGASNWIETESGAVFDTSNLSAPDYTFEGTVSGVGTMRPGTGNDLVIDGTGVIRPGLSSEPHNIATAGDQIGHLTVAGNLMLAGDGVGVDRLILGMGATNVADYNDAANFAAHGGAGFSSWLTTQGDAYDAYTGGNHDRLTINGTLTLQAGGQIAFENSGSAYDPVYGDIFNLMDWTSLSDNGFDEGGTQRPGGLWGDLNLPSLDGSLFWDTSLFGSHGIVVVVPEPSRAGLIALAFFALLMRRRRHGWL